MTEGTYGLENEVTSLNSPRGVDITKDPRIDACICDGQGEPCHYCIKQVEEFEDDMLDFEAEDTPVDDEIRFVHGDTEV